MKKHNILLISFFLAASMLLSACGGGGAALLPAQAEGVANAVFDTEAKVVESQIDNSTQQAAGAAAQTPLPAGANSGNSTGSVPFAALNGTLTEIYEEVNPSVVNIQIKQAQDSDVSTPEIPGNPHGSTPQAPDIPFFGFPGMPDGSEPPQYGYGLGSGFVWNQDGYLVTNNHVVDGADEIEVTFHDGITVDAELVGADPDSDLAVLKVELPTDQLKPVQLADSREVKVGHLAIAIGNPFGLEGTMTVGIISALGRSLPAGEGNQAGPSYSIPDLIQTDAPINPGNSGGVLVNEFGQVTGVTFAIESPVPANAGIGFVIPSAIVERVIPALIEDGHYQHSYLGISGSSLNPDLAAAMGLEGTQQGALVGSVTPDGPADQAGLQGSDQPVQIDEQEALVGGDVIIGIDDQPVKDMDDLIAYLTSNTEVGSQITLTVLRDGAQMDVQVTLGARPSQGQTAQAPANSPEDPAPRRGRAKAWMGIVGLDLNPQINNAMGLGNNQSGVLVEQVDPDSPADKAGLRGGDQSLSVNGQNMMVGGDVILTLDGQDIGSTQDLVALLSTVQPGQEVTLTVQREGHSMQLSLTLGERP